MLTLATLVLAAYSAVRLARASSSLAPWRERKPFSCDPCLTKWAALLVVGLDLVRELARAAAPWLQALGRASGAWLQALAVAGGCLLALELLGRRPPPSPPPPLDFQP